MDEKLACIPFYRDALIAYKVYTTIFTLLAAVVVWTHPTILTKPITNVVVRVLRACMCSCLRSIAIACIDCVAESREDGIVISLVHVLDQ
jgi:hypothetical protein